MLKFAKYTFFSTCAVIMNAALFMLFGAVIAFAFLAVQPSPEIPRSTSPLLAEFLDSQEKVKVFSLQELRGGVAHLIYKCATKGMSVPVEPSFSTSGKYLDVGLPVTVQFFSENVKVWAFVSLSFDAREVLVESARIGNARLPMFAARNVAKSIFGFYAPISSLKEYIDILGRSKIEVLADGNVRIEK